MLLGQRPHFENHALQEHLAIKSCNHGNVLRLYCPPASRRPQGCLEQAVGATEEPSPSMPLLPVNTDLNSHVWLMATRLNSAALSTSDPVVEHPGGRESTSSTFPGKAKSFFKHFLLVYTPTRVYDSS